jgi:hypothetical protein
MKVLIFFVFVEIALKFNIERTFFEVKKNRKVPIIIIKSFINLINPKHKERKQGLYA